MTGLENERSNLCGHSDQTYETFHLHCYMLIYLIRLSMLKTMNSVSRKTIGLKKGAYVVRVIKFLKHFI